jgi:hypothetical protein
MMNSTMSSKFIGKSEVWRRRTAVAAGVVVFVLLASFCFGQQ